MQTQTVAEQSSVGALLVILVAPRKTIRKVVDTDPTRHVLLLAAIAGIDQALSNASSESFGDDNPLGILLVGCLVLGSVGGLISMYFLGALLRWSGRRLGGQASAEEVRAAIAWSNVPIILAMSLWIPELLIFGEELFTTATPRMDANPWLVFVLLGFLAIRLVAAIWAVVLFVKGLAEVHRFSAWRALGAMFLPGLIILVPFVCILGILVTVGTWRSLSSGPGNHGEFYPGQPKSLPCLPGNRSCASRVRYLVRTMQLECSAIAARTAPQPL